MSPEGNLREAYTNCLTGPSRYNNRSLSDTDGELEFQEPLVQQVDLTRDLGGTFFAPDDWLLKYAEFKGILEEKFGTTLKPGRNSFNSCF